MTGLPFFVAVFLFGAPAPPQDNLVSSSVRHEPSDGVFVGGYSVERSGLWVTEFYSRQGGGLPGDVPAYFARRALNTPEGPDQIRWAVSESCPEMKDVLGGLSDLPALAIRVPGISAYSSLLPTGPMTMDGASYAVWGNGRQADGAFVSMTMSSGGGAIARFVEAADRQMADCWKDSRD
ncbi:hypothetical protein [Brevundimonas sp.]|uniref:hypothetical protein n=1 Tax=Brevundimonas sp. TaxID=1871086 RepID=UPI002B9D1E94|nr:hypothetical protein [Brevundimonas sp.]HWQ86016.1 hypothetical protein [Brevundimonas sp.]